MLYGMVLQEKLESMRDETAPPADSDKAEEVTVITYTETDTLALGLDTLEGTETVQETARHTETDSQMKDMEIDLEQVS